MKIIKLPILHYSCKKQNVVKAIVVQMLRVKAIVVTPVLTLTYFDDFFVNIT